MRKLGPICLAAALLGCGRSATFDCTLSVSPAAIDFGAVGVSATQQVELQSLGSDNCTISGVTVEGADAGFSLAAGQPNSFFIPPGASASIGVTFQPGTAEPSPRQSTLVFQTSSFAMPAVSIPMSASVPTCVLQLSPTAVSFGTATLGVPSASQVTLTSQGQFTCSVTDIAIAPASDPGFFVPAGQATSLSVPPGGQATIAVDFEVAQSAAPFARQGTLVVTTSDPDAPQLTVALSAVVPSCSLAISPAALSFGNVGGSGTATQSVSLKNQGTLTCAISSITLGSGTDADFSLTPSQPSSLSIPPGGAQSIPVDFTDMSGGAPPLLRTGTLTFDTSDLTQPSVSIPLSATEPSCVLQVSPTSVAFGTATLGTASTAQVTLTSQGQLTCSVSNVAIAPSSDPGFFIPAAQPTGLTVLPGGQATLAVDFEVAQSAAPFARQGTLTFTTTDLASPQVSVTLSAVVPSCSLAVAPTSINFGTVTVGGSAAQSVTLTSQGTLACAISAIALANGTDADFSLAPGQPASLSIPPGSNQSIPVTFDDLSGDTPPLVRTGTLAFDTGDLTQPTASIPLSASLVCTADSQCPAGQICALTGPTVGTCGSNLGCADGTREGFLATSGYPRIAGCSGGFALPGMPTPAQCGNTSGNSSSNPNGNGCAAADLCAPNFHICFSSGDVANNSSTGCTGSAPTPGLFFACLESGPGCEICGGAQGEPACSFPADCNGCQGFGCENDVFGCGNIGDTPDSSCGVLNEFSNNLCGALPAPWDCPNVNGGCSEFATVTKPGPGAGGVLCCGN